MDEWTRAAAPGAHHAVLDTLRGQWRIASAQSDVEGRAEIEWILGGRFLELRQVSADAPHSPLTGLGLIGYDNLNQRYLSIWVDTNSTNAFITTGHADSGRSSVEFYGPSDDPVSGQRGVMWHVSLRLDGSERFILEFRDPRVESTSEPVFRQVFTRMT